jgi:tetratricopeptide (TPR) repeat protein
MKLKISYFLVFACIITSTKGKAQDPRSNPGLLEDLKTQTSDTGRIQIYSLLCFHYTMANTDTALIYGEKGLRLAEKIRNEKAKADVSNSIGWAYLQRNDYYRAEPFFISALDFWRKENKKTEQKKVMANLGVLYMNKADFSKSFAYMSEVLKLDDETHDNESKAVDLFSVGRLYNMQKNYLEARKYFQQAYELHKQNGNELLMSEVMMSVGNTYQYEGKYAESIKYYDQVIPVFKKLKNTKRLGLAYENKAGFLCSNKRLSFSS